MSRQRVGVRDTSQVMPKLRVHNISVSIDGYAAGPNQDVDNPLGLGGLDEMRLAIVPILLGRDERLFDHLDGGPVGYECVEFVSSPSVTHARFNRQ